VNADLTANGRSSMASSALALARVLVDGRPGAGGDGESLGIELFQRVTRDDYDRWLTTALAAGGCVRPVRLRGTVREVDTATGEILHGMDTEDLPEKAIYVPCGDRRVSVCPPCAETYRADTYQLIRAGLAGGKGMPESLAAHPCVFATFTAPSFGPVHTRVIGNSGRVARCRPRRKASFCPHGRRLSCGQRHKDTDACLGRPLCPDCYDYSAAVAWNAHAPELWRRTTIAIRRRLDKLAKAHGTRVKLSYAKVAEFQRRGLIHFHAVFRLDGHDPVHPERSVPPDPAFTAEVLAEVIQQVASTTWFATVSHPEKPKGWDIAWGAQIDPRVVRLTGGGEVTDTKVAAYLAKYATKSTEPVLRDATHWDEVVTQLGYEHLRRHDLRHTGLTWMADAGVPVHVLRKIAGHGSLVTTQRYLHPDAQSIADAGIALSAHLAVEKGSLAPEWSPNGPQLRLIEGDKA
jgi:hypothetical protein